MSRRFTVLLPAAAPRWEVWSCPSPSSAVLRETSVDAALPERAAGKTIIALPATGCRTLALRVPSQDMKTIRLLAFAQLEKRGLAAASADQTLFECHMIPMPDAGAILGVDVIAPGTAAEFAALRPSGLVASARCYPVPSGVLVLAGEHGQRVLWASRDGVPIHTHIVSAPPGQPDQLAVEIRLTCLALEQQELVTAITAVECWGEFTEAEAVALGSALGMPVRVKPRPTPDPVLIGKYAASGLLPAGGGASARGRRLLLWKWVAAGAAAAAVILWLGSQRHSLAVLEQRAQDLQAAVDSAGGSGPEEKALTRRVRATQERWRGLGMALDPKRYPLIHLNGVTRCLGEGSVVLSRFESKGPDLAVSGTAQTAGEAYTYYSAINADPGLRIYDWSMVQPVIAANGSASFQIKGKMR